MIILLTIICIVFVIGGIYLSANSYRYDDLGYGLIPVGAIGLIGCIIGLGTFITKVVDLKVIDEKIAMYEEENANIESDIAIAVKGYQDYETEIFTNAASDSPIVLVSLYPELKSDELVKSQIDVYIVNNEKIKELKEKKINGKVYRWWLYFGK